MAHEEKLPWELIEEILSHVPPKSLVCFRIVSKRWNALFNDKTFINNHKSTFRFILTTKSNIYSVSIDPEIVVRELTLYVPGLESHIPKNVVDCNEFLLCCMDKVATVWNPWLNQTRVIKTQPGLQIDSIGYDSYKEKVYKTIASYWKELDPKTWWNIHDFATDAWKDIKWESGGNSEGGKPATLHTTNGVSLNGNLYWVAFYDETNPLYHVHEFDFSREHFLKFCDLPCFKNHPNDALILGAFKEDRLSLLKQCHITKKIEIWVTKSKIKYGDVVWMNFMEVSIPNLPDLVHTGSNSQPSYFIDDKRLVVCSCDETGRAWIYVVGENKLVRKIQLDSVVDHWPLHCTYFPSLVPVPRGQREEIEIQV